MTEITVVTPGRGLFDITEQVANTVEGTGIAHVFIRHTSASLVITENADPDVLHDMNVWFDRHVPDGHPAYRHADEGPDDMPSHIRSVLTATSLTVPVRAGALLLGTWQGIFVFEHRTASHERQVVVSVLPI